MAVEVAQFRAYSAPNSFFVIPGAWPQAFTFRALGASELRLLINHHIFLLNPCVE